MSDDLRFYSNGKIEVMIFSDIKNKELIEIQPLNGKMQRIDINHDSKEISAFFSFDELKAANNFINRLKFKPKSVSISNP